MEPERIVDFQSANSINDIHDRNFAIDDNAVVSGWNGWLHMSIATAGTASLDSMFKTLDVPSGAAPEEQSHECLTMKFTKYGTTVDPLVGEIVDSDITVGAVNNQLPTFNTAKDLTSDPNDRYDVMKYDLSAFANIDGSRGVTSNLMPSQDDYIHVMGFDSAGNVDPVMTSWTDVVIPGKPGTDESQAYREFNWQDARGWSPVVGDPNGAWDISTLIKYEVYPIQFNWGR